jgi:hypothetical protein
LGYTLAVHRPLAVCLAIAVAWALARPAPVHVHASGGHHHRSHDHGPATHDHHRPALARDVGPRLSSCDPAAHVVPLTVATTTATASFTVPFDAVEIYRAAEDFSQLRILVSVDPRQHGPPGGTRTPSRAPPSFTAA